LTVIPAKAGIHSVTATRQTDQASRDSLSLLDLFSTGGSTNQVTGNSDVHRWSIGNDIFKYMKPFALLDAVLSDAEA
ncbi:MAG: hypothetical protein ACOCWZ_07700, partial [Spirochaetota bacterium]